MNRKALSLYPFVASFKEISLKSDFIRFFHYLIHIYNPGAGGIQPGDKVLMSTVTSCHFGHLLVVSHQRRQQFLQKSIVLPFSHTKAYGTKFDLAVK